MTDDNGPYKYELAFVGATGGGWRIVGPQGSEKEVYGRESLVIDIVHHRNIGYAEGRTAMKQEIERQGLPPCDPSFDEKEHAALTEKGTKARAEHGDSKGPYSWDEIQGPMVFGPTVPDRNDPDGKFYTSGKRTHCEKLSNALNLAFQAGRDSRDGLRKAVMRMIVNWDYDGRVMLAMAQKALEADGEGQ